MPGLDLGIHVLLVCGGIAVDGLAGSSPAMTSLISQAYAARILPRKSVT